MQYQYRAISAWPGQPTGDRIRSRFKLSFSQVLRNLERELNHLDAQDIIIEADTTERNIRNDGMLRSDAVLNGPGIILSFKSKHGPLRLPCDNYRHWVDNLNAIAKFLENNRANERYGVGKIHQQYAGYRQLPGAAPTEEFASEREAAEFLVEQTGWEPMERRRQAAIEVLTDRDVRETAFRAAAMRAHPDQGGTADLMNKVIHARDYLRKKEAA